MVESADGAALVPAPATDWLSGPRYSAAQAATPTPAAATPATNPTRLDIPTTPPQFEFAFLCLIQATRKRKIAGTIESDVTRWSCHHAGGGFSAACQSTTTDDAF